ncbi:hypothetical protein TNCV_533911 [Trichonephila clavipes]|nr:hypothetical protein TNCV_533911 [Trichonephila clavipes]
MFSVKPLEMDSINPPLPGQVGLAHVMLANRTRSCYLPKLVRFVPRYEMKGVSQETLRKMDSNCASKSYTNAGSGTVVQRDYIEGGCASML